MKKIGALAIALLLSTAAAAYAEDDQRGRHGRFPDGEQGTVFDGDRGPRQNNSGGNERFGDRPERPERPQVDVRPGIERQPTPPPIPPQAPNAGPRGDRDGNRGGGEWRGPPRNGPAVTPDAPGRGTWRGGPVDPGARGGDRGPRPDWNGGRPPGGWQGDGRGHEGRGGDWNNGGRPRENPGWTPPPRPDDRGPHDRGRYDDRGRDHGRDGDRWRDDHRGGSGWDRGHHTDNRWRDRHGYTPGYGRGHYRDRDRDRHWYAPNLYRYEYYSRHRYNAPSYRYPRGWFARTWYYGDYLPGGWYEPYYYLDWRHYGLPYPPIGCEWVRVGADAILVDVWTGQVLSVWYRLFW